MLKGRKYRAYLTREQDRQASEWLHTQRCLWNLALEQRETAYQQFGLSVNYNTQAKDLTELRAEYDWVRNIPAVIQQQCLRDVEQGYRRWWAGTAKKPRFQSRDRHRGMRSPVVGAITKLNRKRCSVVFPKLGAIEYRSHQPLNGQPRSMTLSKDRVGQWWLSILVDDELEPSPVKTGENVVGVDRGIAIDAQASDGRSWNVPTTPESERATYKRLQRKLARQSKGSNRRNQTKRRMAVLSRRKSRRIDWFAHQVSRDLMDSDVVVFEALKIANMTRSAKGTVDEPGRNVAQKSGLNRSILESGWRLSTQHSAVRLVLDVG